MEIFHFIGKKIFFRKSHFIFHCHQKYRINMLATGRTKWKICEHIHLITEFIPAHYIHINHMMLPTIFKNRYYFAFLNIFC